MEYAFEFRRTVVWPPIHHTSLRGTADSGRRRRRTMQKIEPIGKDSEAPNAKRYWLASQHVMYSALPRAF